MSDPIVDELVAKTYRELAETDKPSARSRISKTPNGYIHLVAWSNASLLRILVHRFTDTLSQSHYRLKHQIDDAARSVIANIEEGYARPTTSEYLTFLGYSEASLIEVKGDVQRSLQDGLLSSQPGTTLTNLGIDLRDWHEAVRESVISKPIPSPKLLQNPLQSSKGLYRNLQDFRFNYPPVDNLQAQFLTYEIFIELINKTSWHLRRLVVSLEEKLVADQKYYQVERARIRNNVAFHR